MTVPAPSSPPSELRSAAPSFSVRLGFIAAIGALTLVATLAALLTRSAGQTSQSLVRALDVQIGGQQVLSAVKDAETGQRGYLLTGDPAYLGPYHAAQRDFPQSVARLRALTSSDPDAAQHLNRMEELAQRKLAELARTVALRQRGDVEAALEVVRTNEGKQIMDAFRQEVAAFQDEQRQRSAALSLAQRRSSRRALSAILVGSALLAILILAAWRSTQRDLRIKTDALAQRDLVVRELGVSQRALEELNRELEARVLSRTQELKAANDELETFSYSVSHDLRAPLRAIDGFAQALAEDAAQPLGELATDDLLQIRTASQRMGLLIDDLLQLSRITRTPLRRERVDLSALALELLADLKRLEPARHVEVSVAEGLFAVADPGLCRVLLQNLLANAWKFTSKRALARISLERATLPGQRAFVVVDDGAGFDMRYVDKLFSPFRRLHRESDFAGTGIGLATVRRIVQRHGGQILAEGQPGAGARFTFSLGEANG